MQPSRLSRTLIVFCAAMLAAIYRLPWPGLFGLFEGVLVVSASDHDPKQQHHQQQFVTGTNFTGALTDDLNLTQGSGDTQ